MSKLNMIKSGAGWLVDITELEPNDMIVLKLNEWPFHPGLTFKKVEFNQSDRPNIKDIYYANIDYKPSMGMQINGLKEPDIHVFKAEDNPS